MKKNLFIFFITLGLFTTFSCSKWLDVQPKTQIKQDKLFQSETGFKNALIGIYIMMGDRSLYGKELTCGFLEVIAHQCDLGGDNKYYDLYNHDYNKGAFIIDKIWNKSYRIIANLNAIIEEIETNKYVLTPTAYALIKGEALALRAYLHFDLLRIFGWGGVEYDKSVLDKLSIPYVTRYHKSTTKQSTQREVFELLNKDLDAAIALLYAYDPMSKSEHPDDYSIANDRSFYNARTSRMNYWAALATRVRVAMWEAKYEKALEDLKLLESVDCKWVDIDKTIYNEIAAENDFKMGSEHLFKLDVFKLYEGENSDFSDGLKPLVEIFSFDVGSSSKTNRQYFSHREAEAKLLYEYETIGRGDFRYDRFYKTTDIEWTILKFYEAHDTRSPSKNKMPLIRKPEIFYSAAECFNKIGMTAEAVAKLNEVRVNRGIGYSNNLPSTLSPEEIDLEIEKEWKKEFLGEGHMFYYYKRLNKEVPKAGVVQKSVIFAVPLPRTEVEIGDRVDNI